MFEINEPQEWEEVIKTTDLAKIKSVHEMMPQMAEKNLRRKWGRPQLTEEHFSIIENCLRLDFTITEACDAAWISLSSYYNYYNNDEDFALRMDRAKDFPKMMARTAVMRRIWQWDAKTALRYLELRDKRFKEDHVEEEWGADNKTKVEFTLVSTVSWADQSENDSQTPTKQNLPYDSSVSSWEVEKLTPWENEDSILEKLA